jgi:CheY-like chemotaxis protein
MRDPGMMRNDPPKVMSTILVVDDDEPFREMLRTVLEIRGFHVLVASHTAEGLEIAARHSPDAIISDFQMPKADGLTFCRALQQQNAELNRQVPVWLMTGTVVLTEKEALAAGAVGIFRKPFHAVEIAKTVERHCTARRPAAKARDERAPEIIPAT